MTEAEKAAEVKRLADEAAKQKEAGSKKEDEGDDDEPEDESEKLDPKEHIKKLNAENAKHRLSAKALKAENAKLKEDQARKDKALEILTGKKAGDIDPLEKAKADSDARQKRLLIRAELGTVAKDAHDAGALFKMFPEKFQDIDVDLENDVVSREDLKEVVKAIRAEAPFLFAKKGEKSAHLPGGEPNPDTGTPSGGGNHRAQWNALKASGDKKAAQEYYNKNSKLILAQMSSK